MGIQWSNPTKQVNPKARRLLFRRDPAGWNNVRLQFESLACVARFGGFQLVLPPPSNISHISELFHELHVYDMASLAGVVELASGASEPGPATFFGSLTELVGRLDSDDGGRSIADARGDIVVDLTKTRLQHFECLFDENSERQLMVADTVARMRMAARYRRSCQRAQLVGGLRRGFYHAIHLRRGDFATFRPKTQWDGFELQRLVSSFLTKADADFRQKTEDFEQKPPLLVACVVSANEKDPYPELVRVFGGERRVLRTDELHALGASELSRVLVDTLLLAGAASFAGTPDSTYSLGVWHWRARARALRGLCAERTFDLADLDNSVEAMNQKRVSRQQQRCWARASTFGGLTASNPSKKDVARALVLHNLAIEEEMT